jgi:uncharacterized FlaG/YvyC family protein
MGREAHDKGEQRMNALKIGSTPPVSAITSLGPLPGEAKGTWEGKPGALRSAVDTVIGGNHHPKKAAGRGTEQLAPSDQAARDRDVQEIVGSVNDTLETFGTTSLRLSYDHERQLVVMQVVKAAERAEQEEVIRQIPPEDLLELVERLEELQGVLFDGQA